MLGSLPLKNKVTQADARALQHIVIELAKQQDRRADEMLQMILRLEDLQRGFAYLDEELKRRNLRLFRIMRKSFDRWR